MFSIGGRAHVVGGHILPLLKVVDGHAAIIETHHQHVRMVWMDVAGHHLQVNGFWEVSNLTLPHNVSGRGTQGRKGSSRRTCKQSLGWPGKIFSWELLRTCVFLRLPYISAAQLRLRACAEGHIDRASPKIRVDLNFS